jgi:hypothetical protein
VDLKSEIDLFFSELSEIESHCVGQALRSMSADPAFVEQSERILDHDARFTLLKRMASVRKVSPEVLSQLEGADLRAAELREKRDELARTLSSISNDADLRGGSAGLRRPHRRNSIDVWIPTLGEIETCRAKTAKLQATLQAITRQVGDS